MVANNKSANKNKNKKEKPLIVLTAGGTGGHVFPAEALASELKKKYRLAFVTDRRGQNYKGVLGQLDTYRVSAAGIAGKGILGKIKGVLNLSRGIWQSILLLKKLKPAVVVSFGGYASLPAAFAATRTGVPVVLHEQNAILGRTNRLLSTKAKVVATSFAETGRVPEGVQTEYSGMPVRSEIVKLASGAFPIPKKDGDKINLLVLGGSQGARILSDVVPDALKALSAEVKRNITVAQQCRPEDIDRVTEAYKDCGFDVELKSFFKDMSKRLKKVHLVISRSGASTVAELTTSGKPAIYVPYMYATDDHQTANARAMDEVGAAWLIPQESFSVDTLSARVETLLADIGVLQKTAECAKAASRPDAAVKLAKIVETVI
ncbi:MAG: undecaprenyldiphospho-muramoylpentapeptide beta-N-acetylglucosaminyltransferase [Alphaproteobacteria bacterium]|nr:undecaprenyldiphospho-muramoylpentapeptide beta-N-acetylglucosaminyltransferase [Alphaproteobacteria bacterium]